MRRTKTVSVPNPVKPMMMELIDAVAAQTPRASGPRFLPSMAESRKPVKALKVNMKI
jgi:hypothetical protein